MNNDNLIYPYPENIFRIAFEKFGFDSKYEEYFGNNNKENMALMKSVLTSLPKRYREIIELHFNSNYSIREISDYYRVSYNRIYTLYYTALKRLLKYTEDTKHIHDITNVKFNSCISDDTTLEELHKTKLITARIYNSLRFFYRDYIDTIEERIDSKCMDIPIVRDIISNKPTVCNVRFIKLLFYTTKYGKPYISKIRNLGRDSITILADTLGYQRGSNIDIDSLIHADSNKIKYSNISSKMENLEAEINDLDKIDNKHIDRFLSKLDELKNLIESKR